MRNIVGLVGLLLSSFCFAETKPNALQNEGSVVLLDVSAAQKTHQNPTNKTATPQEPKRVKQRNNKMLSPNIKPIPKPVEKASEQE